MTEKASHQDTRHLMKILREAMSDPALSGGCFLLGELFSVIAEESEARALLDEIPSWKLPGLLLSAALLSCAYQNPRHPLAAYVREASLPLDSTFREAVRQALRTEKKELLELTGRHTYQCNPPRRMAVSLLVASALEGDWTSALHIDVGTASGIGLLLGEVAVDVGGVRLGPNDASLEYPLQLRGEPLDLSALKSPTIQRSVGIDLDPPDLRDLACLEWIRACQFPVPGELAFFDEAVKLLFSRAPQIQRGSATDLMPALVAEMPPDQPLIVTDTYVSLFMSEQDRECLRRELDVVAQSRPVLWISNNTLVPAGPAPEWTTAGTTIPAELIERNQHELFGVVCATTWPAGKRAPRIVALNHPGACWLEWRPDLAALGSA